MDRKTIVIIVVCVAFLVFYRPLLGLLGLGHYLDPPRPTAPPVDTTVTQTRVPDRIPPPVAAPSDTATLSARRFPAAPPALERTLALETDLYRATFSSRGARLVSMELKNYAAAHQTLDAESRLRHERGGPVPPGHRVVMAGGPLFGVDLGAGDDLRDLGALTYEVAESTDASGRRTAITFTAHDSAGASIRQTYRMRPDTYAFDLEVELRGIPAAWRISEYSLTTRSWPTNTEADSAGDARALRASSLVGSSLRREHVGGLLKAPKRFDGNVSWAGVQSRYFFGAVAVVAGPSRSVIASGRREAYPPGNGPGGAREVASSSLVMGLPAESSPVQRFVLYTGPSEYFRLSAVGHQLERAVDLGWAWIHPFSKALLQLLNWLYAVVKNYGVAILLLATLVRVALHPLNMMSMKSMRAMQKLQPEMERIREKYKKDPQAMNTAVMALYKENKVNPAGGCLPMLLQMPLFVALYQVLFNAIELRQAPFVAWMNDLSAPDTLFEVAGFPIRMLPVLMLGSGLLAQVVTPTDPRQRGTMYMMNVIMLVFFYNLPSGLVLYWTIMNVLTAFQQWMVLRHDAQVTTTPAPAPVPVVTKRAKRRRTAGS
jgi:YidC/Oxa1 family membrane protein insertase